MAPTIAPISAGLEIVVVVVVPTATVAELEGDAYQGISIPYRDLHHVKLPDALLLPLPSLGPTVGLLGKTLSIAPCRQHSSTNSGGLKEDQ